MRRRPVPLTAGDVDRLPGRCADCLFWELGGPCPQPRSPTVLGGIAPAVSPEEAARPARARKRDWVGARVQEDGPPGARIEVVVDGGSARERARTAAFALFAPAERYAPRAGSAPRTAPGAMLLATVWVDDVFRGQGLGRLLLQTALRETLRQDRPALQAYGDRRFRERSCLLPATWLLHEGLTVHREHPRVPLFHLDVGRTARWAESLEHALEEVLARLPRPERAPVPDRSGSR
ncbi:MAG: hypothetical protein R6U94_02350 [Nitriliruptoraceae bacterium]